MDAGDIESSVPPTPSPGDVDVGTEWTVQEQVYATVGFILRFFLPIVFIMLCCRVKLRRGGRSFDGDSFNNEEEGSTQEQRQQDREKFVSETLYTKKVVAADDKDAVPSFEDDALEKGDVAVPKRNVEDDEESAVPSEFDAPSCSICFSEYQPGETICWSRNPDCSHAFHSECMTKWLIKHDDCPHCRQEYLKAADKTEAGDAREAGAPDMGSSLQVVAGDGSSEEEGNGQNSIVGEASAEMGMVDINLETGTADAVTVTHSAEIASPIVRSSGR